MRKSGREIKVRVAVKRSNARLQRNANMRWSRTLRMYLRMLNDMDCIIRTKDTDSPGGVVIFGSQDDHSPLQYACACGTWKGSSCRQSSIWCQPTARRDKHTM